MVFQFILLFRMRGADICSFIVGTEVATTTTAATNIVVGFVLNGMIVVNLQDWTSSTHYTPFVMEII